MAVLRGPAAACARVRARRRLLLLLEGGGAGVGATRARRRDVAVAAAHLAAAAAAEAAGPAATAFLGWRRVGIRRRDDGAGEGGWVGGLGLDARQGRPLRRSGRRDVRQG